MAAVTVNRRRTVVAGNRKLKIFDITGNNTNTLDTRLKRVETAAFTPTTNTPTAAAESTVNGYITLTFTSGGAYTNQKLVVIGT